MTSTTTQSVTSTERRTIRRKLDESPTKTPELRGDGGAVRPALRRIVMALQLVLLRHRDAAVQRDATARVSAML